jgi:hypothetical protein
MNRTNGNLNGYLSVPPATTLGTFVVLAALAYVAYHGIVKGK